MTNLIEALAGELERPRDVSAQVVNHVIGTYGVDRDAVGTFLVGELSKLEDYEIDLILSPLFTPTLQDQAVFAALLGVESVPSTQWPALVQKLVARPTIGQFVPEDGNTHSVPLRAVTVERYVYRLRLDGTTSESVRELISQVVAEADRSLLKAVARRAIWESDSRRDILARHLAACMGTNDYRAADAVELLKLVETYQPADVREVLARIPHWQQVLKQEINDASSPKPFFNERVQELHGGGRDRRRADDSRVTAKEEELEFLNRLQTLLSASGT